MAVAERLPVVSVTWTEPELRQQWQQQEGVDVEQQQEQHPQPEASSSYSIGVTLTRVGARGSRQAAQRVYAPRFPKVGTRFV